MSKYYLKLWKNSYDAMQYVGFDSKEELEEFMSIFNQICDDLDMKQFIERDIIKMKILKPKQVLINIKSKLCTIKHQIDMKMEKINNMIEEDDDDNEEED